MTIEDSERTALLTMALVIANAQRLLDDSRLLFEHRRFPTSLSIAVLSIEESGKALLMCRAVKQKDLRHHVTKQTDAALQLVQNALIAAVRGAGWWGNGAGGELSGATDAPSDQGEARFLALISALDELRKSDVVRRYLEMQAGEPDPKRRCASTVVGLRPVRPQSKQNTQAEILEAIRDYQSAIWVT